MKATDKQRAALNFIHNNPGAKTVEISAAAGASTSGDNSAAFLSRLVDSGLAQVIVSADVFEAIENGAL